MGTIINLHRNTEVPNRQRPKVFASRLLSLVMRSIWLLAVMTWPVLRWIVALDVTIHFFRMLVIFADKGIYADWTFIAHFTFLVALTYFVTAYKPH
jgi:Uncharacterized KleE stable inheritance protein